MHQSFECPVWYSVSSHTHLELFPATRHALKGLELGIETAKAYGIHSMINCLWSDNGSDCSKFSALPSIMYFSYKAMGKELEEIRRDFMALTGMQFDDFVLLDIPRSVNGNYIDDSAAPTSYFLYNDLFSGQFDCYVKDENIQAYEDASKIYKNLRNGEYAYIFETAYRLCEVMKIKCPLGVRVRQAYKEKNNKELKKICSDIKILLKRLDTYMEALRKQWFTDYKPNGLEVQEIRIGGLMQRLKGCRKVLIEYVKGKIGTIPELECELLDEVLASSVTTRMKYDGYVLVATNNEL